MDHSDILKLIEIPLGVVIVGFHVYDVRERRRMRRNSGERPPGPSLWSRIRIGAVIRDTAIVQFLTFLAGLVIGIFSGGQELSMGAMALGNLILATLGFFIVGCLNKTDRLKHLSIVAVCVWVTSLINFLFIPFNLLQWIGGLPVVFVMMLIGGGLSFLVVRKPVTAAPTPST